jgi:GT2 family glycosyltransferase
VAHAPDQEKRPEAPLGVGQQACGRNDVVLVLQGSKMSISVIIPTRNRLAFLREAVASVQVQGYRNWEAIIIDDASTDGTWEWLASLGDPRIQSFRMEERRERSAARNLGLRAAQGERVLFLDDDDRLEAHALLLLSSALDQHPDAIAAVGGRLYFDDRGPRRKFRLVRWPVKRVFWPDVLLGFSPVPGEGLIQKAAIVSVGSWNENLSVAEDHDLWLRLARAGRVVITSAIVLHLRMHAGQTQFAGVRHVEQQFRAEFVRRLPPSDRMLGERLHQAHRALTVGSSAFSRGRYKRACGFFLDSMLKAPRLLISPVSGPAAFSLLARSALGMVLGRRGMAFFRKLKARLKSNLDFGNRSYSVTKPSDAQTESQREGEGLPMAPRRR